MENENTVIYFKWDYFWPMIFLLLLISFGLTYLDFMKTGHFHFIGLLIGLVLTTIIFLYFRRSPEYIKLDSLNRTLLVHQRWPRKEYWIDISQLSVATAKIVSSGRYYKTHLDLFFSNSNGVKTIYFDVQSPKEGFWSSPVGVMPDEVLRLVDVLNTYITNLKKVSE